jgi:predicted amidohydrolase
VILPELWLQGAFEFSFFSEKDLSRIESKLEILGEVAKENNYWLHAGSFLVREGTYIFNKTVLFDSDGKIRASYRKNYVFGFGDGEAKFVSPSTDCEIVETPWGRIGFAICYDLRFPEHFRRVTLAGAEIILICAAWPETRIGHWRNLICSRAIENQLLVIGCNGVGEQTEATLGGNSIIVAPDGETLLELGNKQSVTFLEVDTRLIQEQRVSFPVLKDIK